MTARRSLWARACLPVRGVPRTLASAFVVALCAIVVSVPASAASTPTDAGAVAVAGTVTYTSSPGDALGGVGGCVWDQSFDVSLTGVATDINLPGSEYTGPVSLTGSGLQICMDYVDGGGAGMSYTLTGTGPVGELRCSGTVSIWSFAGLWSWNGGSSGSCSVANGPITNVSLTGFTETLPAGVTTSGNLSALALSGVLKICAPYGAIGC